MTIPKMVGPEEPLPPHGRMKWKAIRNVILLTAVLLGFGETFRGYGGFDSSGLRFLPVKSSPNNFNYRIRTAAINMVGGLANVVQRVFVGRLRGHGNIEGCVILVFLPGNAELQLRKSSECG